MHISNMFLQLTFTLFLFTSHCHAMDEPQEVRSDPQSDFQKAKKTIGTLIGLISPELSTYLNGEPEAITNNPYKNQVAYVRQTPGISDGEKECLIARLPIVKAGLQKLLNRQLEDHQIPKIAFVMSGGGYRALLCSLGCLLGSEKIGLLDTSTYITALSGSTWAVAPWISIGLPLKTFNQYILDCVAKAFTDVTDEEELLLFQAAIVKALYKQAKTPVDLYGALLGNRLLAALGDKRHMTYISEHAEKIKDGKYPYPIYTAVDGNEDIIENPMWYEFTPHEIGACNSTTHIPTWAYGRKFKEGKSVNNAPEKSLSYQMGTYGSAFAANVKTIKEELAKVLGHEDLIESIATSIEGERPLDFYAKVPNFTYKMNTGKPEPKEQLFVDAGLDFNNPVTPVVYPERKADILIICDASADRIGDELKKTCDYMKRNNLAFPEINFDVIGKKAMHVFKDKNNPYVPTVLYFPRISDPALLQNYQHNHPQSTKYNILQDFDLDHETNNGFAKTIHFQYEPQDAERVIRQMEFNVRANQEKIIKTFKWVIDNK